MAAVTWHTLVTKKPTSLWKQSLGKNAQHIKTLPFIAVLHWRLCSITQMEHLNPLKRAQWSLNCVCSQQQQRERSVCYKCYKKFFCCWEFDLLNFLLEIKWLFKTENILRFSSNFQKSIIKFMSKTLCNLIKTPFLPTITFLYLATNQQTTKTTTSKGRSAIKLLKWAGPRVCQGIIPGLGFAWLSSHPPWPFLIWAEPQGAQTPTPKHRAGGLPSPPSPSQGSQATGHKLQNPLQYFPFYKERQRGEAHGEKKKILSSAINYSARFCP